MSDTKAETPTCTELRAGSMGTGSGTPKKIMYECGNPMPCFVHSPRPAETPMVVCEKVAAPHIEDKGHISGECRNPRPADAQIVTCSGKMHPSEPHPFGPGCFGARPADAPYTTKAINTSGADFTLVNGEPLPADKAAKISAGIGPQTFTPSLPGDLPVEVTAYRGDAQGVAAVDLNGCGKKNFGCHCNKCREVLDAARAKDVSGLVRSGDPARDLGVGADGPPANLPAQKVDAQGVADATAMDGREFLTSGQRANLSIDEHRQRLKVLFEENESGISPDTMLRIVLLDADRFADEFSSLGSASELARLRAENARLSVLLVRDAEERDEMRATIESLKGQAIRGDVEPHLRTEGEIRDLFPRLESLSDSLCQTQTYIFAALIKAGLTVVPLDPAAREVVPDQVLEKQLVEVRAEKARWEALHEGHSVACEESHHRGIENCLGAPLCAAGSNEREALSPLGDDEVVSLADGVTYLQDAGYLVLAQSLRRLLVQAERFRAENAALGAVANCLACGSVGDVHDGACECTAVAALSEKDAELVALREQLAQQTTSDFKRAERRCIEHEAALTALREERDHEAYWKKEHADSAAALATQLAAKDAEIAALRKERGGGADNSDRLGDEIRPRHWSLVPFIAVCGADYNNMGTTPHPLLVECVSCSHAAYATLEKQLTESRAAQAKAEQELADLRAELEERTVLDV